MEKATYSNAPKGDVKSSLVEQYSKSPHYGDMQKHLHEVYEAYEGVEEAVVQQAVYPTSMFVQVGQRLDVIGHVSSVQ